MTKKERIRQVGVRIPWSLGCLAWMLVLGCSSDSDDDKRAAPAAAGPTILSLDSGYNAYVLPQGDFSSLSDGGSSCCGSTVTISQQQGDGSGNNQGSQVQVGSGGDQGINQATPPPNSGVGAGGLQQAVANDIPGAMAAQSIETANAWEDPPLKITPGRSSIYDQPVPIEIVTGKGEVFFGTADMNAIPGRIAIQAESFQGANLVGTMSTYQPAGYPVRLTYVDVDGQAEKLAAYRLNPMDALQFTTSMVEAFGE